MILLFGLAEQVSPLFVPGQQVLFPQNSPRLQNDPIIHVLQGLEDGVKGHRLVLQESENPLGDFRGMTQASPCRERDG